MLWLIATLLWVAVPQAQAQDESNLWIGPRLLSSPGVKSTSETVMLPDPHGFMHVFWAETDPDTERRSIFYATFDGEIWSEPVDIYLAGPDVDLSSFGADLDNNGRLHLLWTEGQTGPVLYASADALSAASAHAWSQPISVQFPAFRLNLQVDSKGVLHMMFLNFYGREPGIYYSRSEDGETWSRPFWLDPDIPIYDSPNTLKFIIDDQDGLHASWYYAALDLSSPLGEWIRYTHSFDGGETWRTPVTIDRADDAPDELRQPYPGLAVSGDTVHLVYAGNSTTQREHRYSLDRGVTWGETERVLGDLQGQALGDGITVDGDGRLHFFGQIRWPQGVYHSTWDPASPEAGWTVPKMGYVISSGPEEGREGRYHAHSVRAATLNGNILVVSFTDEAAGPLYVMWRQLDDVEKTPPIPTPTETPIPVATETPVAPLTPVPTPPPFSNTLLPVRGTPNAGNGLWIGVIPTILLVAGIVSIQLLRKRR